MSGNIVSKLGLSLFYFVATVCIEIMTFAMLNIGLFPEHLLYNLAVILMFAGIIFIIPNYLAQYIVSMVLIVAQVVIMYVNYSLYHLYGDVFSFDMITLFKETKQAITTDFTFIWLIVFLVLLVAVIATIGFFVFKHFHKYKMPFSKNFSCFVVMMLLIVQGLGLSIYTQQRTSILKSSTISDENYVLSDSFLVSTSMLKIASLKSLGSYGYYVNNIMNLLFDKGSKSFKDEAIEFFNNGENFDATDSNTFGIAKGDNVICVMMESLEWYPFTNGNHEESYIFSEELTPNVYKLINEGVIATDFFAKSKTNISEGVGIMGSYPIGKYMEQVATSSNKDNFGFTLPNMLKNSEYEYDTSYVHANNGSYYARKTTHKNIGFDHLYFGDTYLDKEVEWNDWIEEAKFVQTAIDKGYLIPHNAKDGQRFYSFYTTVSSHGPYDKAYSDDRKLYEEDVLNSNWYAEASELFDNTSLTYLKNFMSSIIGFDKALGVIIDTLQEYGIYDNTTIILYSDHNAYYHTISNTIKGVNKSDYSDIELNTIPFVIKCKALTDKIKQAGYYSSTNTSGVRACDDRYGNLTKDGSRAIYSTDRFCSAYDIVPTVLDLLGIEFNKNLYAGNSLFADIGLKATVVENGVARVEDVVSYYSHTGGIYCEYGNTKDMNKFKLKFDENLTSEDYLEKFKTSGKNILIQLNYVSTLYSLGVYSKL